jgi:hypothetical protein
MFLAHVLKALYILFIRVHASASQIAIGLTALTWSPPSIPLNKYQRFFSWHKACVVLSLQLTSI